MMAEVEITWTTREVVYLPPDAAADGSPYIGMKLTEDFDSRDAVAVDIQVVSVGG